MVGLQRQESLPLRNRLVVETEWNGDIQENILETPNKKTQIKIGRFRERTQ